NPHIESEYESSSENDNSQSKMVIDDDEEKMVSVDEIPIGRSLLEEAEAEVEETAQQVK
ncbi:hypothetical protein A2U01_0059104, partial [Trifolium medium]|nr:hypothetical protein [Trifolium medium]